MRKYLDIMGFLHFLLELEVDKPAKLFTESKEDSSIAEYTFKKTVFTDEEIILYEHPVSCCVGILQDTPVAPYQDYAEGVYEDLVQEGEYKIFIEV